MVARTPHKAVRFPVSAPVDPRSLLLRGRPAAVDPNSLDLRGPYGTSPGEQGPGMFGQRGHIEQISSRSGSRALITRQSSREAIRELQRGLIAAGFSPGRVDGVLGRRTRDAIRDFQEANGLDADGKAGPQTQRALYSGSPVDPAKSGATGGLAGAALATRLAEPPRLPQPRPELQAVRPAPPPGTFPVGLPIAQGVRPAPDPTLASQALPRSVNPMARGGPVGIPQAPRMSNMDVAREMRVQRARMNPPSEFVGNPQDLKQRVAEMKAAEFQRLTTQMAEQPHRAATIMAQIEALDGGSRPNIPVAPARNGPAAIPRAATGLAPTRNDQIAAQLRKDIRAGDLASQGEGMSALRSMPEAPQATFGTYSPPAASTLANIPNSDHTLSASLKEFLQKGKDLFHIDNMDTTFSANLEAMLRDAPANVRAEIFSGYRSPERQRQLWDQALQKYGSPEAARKWVAPPGRSFHNKGLAADLKYLSPDAEKWVHENAKKYGLHFPLSNEPWHIEPVGARNGKITSQPDSVVRKGSNPGAITALQSSLSRAGFDPGGIDGKYGANTEAAIRAFQQARGLVVDGKAGPNTQRALLTEPGTRGALAYGSNNYQPNSVLARSPSPDPWASIASRTQLPTDPRVGMPLGQLPARAMSNDDIADYGQRQQLAGRGDMGRRMWGGAPPIADLARGAMPAYDPLSSVRPSQTAAGMAGFGMPGGGQGGGGWGGSPSASVMSGAQQQTASRYDPLSSVRPAVPTVDPSQLASAYRQYGGARQWAPAVNRVGMTANDPIQPTPVPTTPISYASQKPSIDRWQAASQIPAVSDLAAQYRAYGSGRLAMPPPASPIPVVAPPRAPPPVMAQAPVPTVPTVPTAPPPVAPAPTVPGAPLWSAIQRGAKAVGGAMMKPAVTAWLSSGPTALAARASQARGAAGFWDQMGRLPGGPTDIARASFLAAQMFGGGQPRNERGQYTSGGSRSGNYGGGGYSGYQGGGSRYSGPGSGGYTNRSGGA